MSYNKIKSISEAYRSMHEGTKGTDVINESREMFRIAEQIRELHYEIVEMEDDMLLASDLDKAFRDYYRLLMRMRSRNR